MTIGCCFSATRSRACRSACCWRATSPARQVRVATAAPARPRRRQRRLPSYNELQGWLSDQPEGEKASRSTVSNALMMLRITRWLSLCQRLRDEQSGRITGNLYALHDAPLTHADACRMDSEYLALLTACSRHRNRRIRNIAIGLLLSLQQPVDSGRTCTESPLKTTPGLNRGLSKKCPSLQLRLSDVAGLAGNLSRLAYILVQI